MRTPLLLPPEYFDKIVEETDSLSWLSSPTPSTSPTVIENRTNSESKSIHLQLQIDYLAEQLKMMMQLQKDEQNLDNIGSFVGGSLSGWYGLNTRSSILEIPQMLQFKVSLGNTTAIPRPELENFPAHRLTPVTNQKIIDHRRLHLFRLFPIPLLLLA